jgi:hypothetical protein
MTIRLLATLVAAAAILGAAAPARADNIQLLTLVIKWSAVMYQDAGALGPAVDKGPAQADRAALQLERDAAAAVRSVGAAKPSSPVGAQIRAQLALALATYQASGRELHFAVVAAERNDAKGATAHVTKAVSLAQTGGAQMTRASKLLPRLKA